MLAKPVAFFVLSASVACAALAQWTSLPPDPVCWPYGDSVNEPPDSQQRNVDRQFSIFANGKFCLLGGRTKTNYQEGFKEWALTNRHSHFSMYDPVKNAWECAETKRILQYTGAVTPVDDLTFTVASDITGLVQSGDQILVVPVASPTTIFGTVDTITYDGGTGDTTVVLLRIPSWRDWMVPPDWVSDPGDTLYIVTVNGLTGLNDATGTACPENSHGYCSLNNAVAAYDCNNDGLEEIFVFGGYPHWPPKICEYYDYAANSWTPGGAIASGDVYAAGAQVGSQYVYHTNPDQMDIYDLAGNAWFYVDPIPAFPLFEFYAEGVGYEDIGPYGTAYFFMGKEGTQRTVEYAIASGVVTDKTPPPGTAYRATVVKYGKKALILGGGMTSDYSSATDQIQIYDVLTDSWCISAVRLPMELTTPGAAVSTLPSAQGAILYIGGGQDNAGNWRNDAYKVSIISILLPALTGVMDLDSHVAPQNVTGVVELYNPGGAVVLETIPVQLDASGNFLASSTLAAGTYDVRLTAPNFLAVRIPNVVLPTCGAVDVGTNFMVNGDGDASNQIDLPDLNAVLINFGKPGPVADYNGDGTVEIIDMNIVFLNFGKTGDP